ncbi:MAG: glycosyltransferase family 39 protein, partial [Alphaproteobacteria bacterium]|nr:glycosyltransferase family 39 protein [Alphaproteobacteria bacterium]
MTQQADTADTPDAPAPAPIHGPAGMALAVGAITFLRLVYLWVSPLDLHPDEAQYWSWSLALDWGYFSKPPMVAWLIAASTAFCGTAEACVRLASPLAHAVAAGFIYGAGSCLYDRRAGFWAALLYLTLPGVSFSSLLVSTDPPLLACWAAAFYVAVRLREGEAYSLGWWAALGVTLGLGLLSKYAMAFFLLGLVLWLIVTGSARRELLGHGRGWFGLLIALAAAGLLILPNLVWNLENGFVTFSHTAANANFAVPHTLAEMDLKPRKAVEFLASQLGVFGPLTLAVLLGFLIWPWSWIRDHRARMLAAFTLASLLPILAVSLLSRAHANWAATAYVAASVWVAGALCDKGAGRLGGVLLKGSILLHLAAAAAVLGGAVGQAAPGVFWGKPVPARLEPFKYYVGWRALGEKITAVQEKHPGLPLLSSDRMMIASALYYVSPQPVILLAWYPGGPVSDHYELTRPWKGPLGADAL